MDLISITEKMLRHKLALLPVVLLMAVGVAYVVAVKAPVYDVTSEYILLSPPSPPTDAQIARDPALGRVSANNPYMDFGDMSVVANLLSQVMSTDAVKASLVSQGANPAYTVVPSAQFGLTTPFLEVTGVGATPQAAMQTARLVGRAVIKQMDALQKAQGVNPHYYIKPSPFTAPSTPQLQVSSKIRMLVGVLAVGTILAFVVLSVMTGLAERKQLKRYRDEEFRAAEAAGDETVDPDLRWPVDWSSDLPETDPAQAASERFPGP
jgi:hypothetical protein